MIKRVSIIGPSGAGKSTQSKLLSEHLGLPHVILDAVCWDYYLEFGYDLDHGRFLYEKEMYQELLDYQKPFFVRAVARFLDEHPEGVMDFGGGQTAFMDQTGLIKIKERLKGQSVFLILPFQDLDQSFDVLSSRSSKREAAKVEGDTAEDRAQFEQLERFRDWMIKKVLRSAVNPKLATKIVYGLERKPDEILQDIIAGLDQPGT